MDPTGYIICNTAVINGLNSGKNDSALYEYISSGENVFIDITRHDSLSFITGEMHKRIGSAACFGTMAPFQYIHRV